MKNKDTSFSNKVKIEIMNNEAKNKKEIISELYGILLSKNSFNENEIIFKTELDYLAERVHKILKELNELDYDAAYVENLKIVNYIIKIENKKDFFSINFDKKWLLKGFFLGSGYIKEPIKGYSVDFFIEKKESFELLYSLLSKVIKKVHKSKKQNNYLIYIRSSEDILDLLIYLDCVNGYFEYQNTIINKEISLNITRNINYEIANETKKLMASSEQIKIIEKICETVGFNSLSAPLKELVTARIENEEASLQELADKLNITKSGIRSRFRRLKEIYDRIQKL